MMSDFFCIDCRAFIAPTSVIMMLITRLMDVRMFAMRVNLVSPSLEINISVR